MEKSASLLWSSMCKRFLKLNLDNDEADFLALRHPNAFILLYFIAKRARRIPGQADGLIIGQCHIGDFKSYGLTEREYRTAKSVLTNRKIIKIIETNRTRKKSTTGTTTVGTLVQLLDSKVWDINPETKDDRNDVRATTERRPSDDEEERRRKDISNDISNEEDAHPAAQLRTKDLLTFNFESWKFEGILDSDISDWKLMYPHIDIQVETLKATQWLKNNPSRNKKKNWRKYLTGWYGRSNDSIENKKAYRSATGGTTQDRRTKNKDGTPISSRAEDLF
jgi:hypothetical protein